MLCGLFRFASANIGQIFDPANIFAKKIKKNYIPINIISLGVLNFPMESVSLYVMRRVFIIAVLLVWCGFTKGQVGDIVADISSEQVSNTPTEPQKLLFDGEVHYFGRINEVDGAVSHTFVFTNTFLHPITIERVYTSCGCTNTDYSRKAVEPGQKGRFTVEFNPEGREGVFDKRVTIVYNDGKSRTHLRVKGEVVGRPRSVADLYPHDLGGGVRADGDYKAFGNVAQGKSRSMTIALINTRESAVTVGYVWTEASGAAEVNFPTELEAGEVALATITYAPHGGLYGLLRDKIEVLVNGERTGRKITTTAVGIDNFDSSTEGAKRGHTPRTKSDISPIFHDFGGAHKGQRLSVDVTITNRGDAPLVVRSITPRSGTEIALRAGDEIAPGESRVVEVNYTVPIEGYDTVYGGAMIVVNDPLKPVRELRVAANVVSRNR